MKVAIMHEMFVKLGGAEKVVETFIKMYPDADLFTLIYDEKKVGSVFKKEKFSKQIFKLKSQKIYNLLKNQRYCLPFMASSTEKLDFSDYDLVLVSSSGFAHGIKTGKNTKQIVYSHSPARYMWDWTNEYKNDIGFNKGIKSLILNYLFLKLRVWDYNASSRADIIIANSENTKQRIIKYHRKKPLVLFPGVETERFQKILDFKYEYSDYYIIISALTEFKRIDVAINAFNKMPDKNLIIIGKGEQKEELNNLIKNENIKLIGAKYGDELVSLVQNSNGMIFPGEEDFGIVPIEVMAAGKPVFALNKGGLTETVIKGITGDFFEDKNGSDFIKNFKIFEKTKYNPVDCKKQAEKFDEKNFIKNLNNIINT